jgi:hypothetical protein
MLASGRSSASARLKLARGTDNAEGIGDRISGGRQHGCYSRNHSNLQQRDRFHWNLPTIILGRVRPVRLRDRNPVLSRSSTPFVCRVQVQDDDRVILLQLAEVICTTVLLRCEGAAPATPASLQLVDSPFPSVERPLSRGGCDGQGSTSAVGLRQQSASFCC